MKTLNTVVAKEKIEVIKSIDTFTGRISEIVMEKVIFILMPSSRNELHIMNSIYELIFNTNPIILILPDREKETANLGFRLCPLFVDYTDSNFMGLKVTLNKMVNKNRIN